MRYPRDMKHLEYNIRSDHNARTSNTSRKLRYWRIKSMHVRVELLNDHGGTSDWGTTKLLPTPTIDNNRKCSVREIRQNDLAFRMNASSKEVLKEVWFGFLITEPDRKRCRIRKSGCPRTKRVPGRSRFAFGCHRSKLTHTEEREREKQSKKSQAIQIYQNILKRKNICMGMHEHLTCNRKSIMGSAQSKPISTQSVAHIQHTSKCMKILL